MVHHPDNYLGVFFHAEPNAHTKSHPQGTFLLQQNGSPFTVGEVEENLNLPGLRHAHHSPLTIVHRPELAIIRQRPSPVDLSVLDLMLRSINLGGGMSSLGMT